MTTSTTLIYSLRSLSRILIHEYELISVYLSVRTRFNQPLNQRKWISVNIFQYFTVYNWQRIIQTRIIDWMDKSKSRNILSVVVKLYQSDQSYTDSLEICSVIGIMRAVSQYSLELIVIFSPTATKFGDHLVQSFLGLSEVLLDFLGAFTH